MAKHNIKILSIDYSKAKKRSLGNINKLEKELTTLKQSENTSTVSEQIEILKNKISEYYDRQFKAYKLRPKANVIENNEKSTKYFFDLEKQRSKNKLWTKIKTDKGETLTGIKDILNEQNKFYENLFSSEGCNENSADLLLNNLNTK